MVKLGELMMILELHRQGLKVSAIARQLGVDRKTVRRYIARGLVPPTYGPRPPQQKSTDPFLPYLRERLGAFPGLTAVRLWRELRERGYAGGYTAVKRAVRGMRPDPITPFEVRFETPPGVQGQVDLARFEVEFMDEPGMTRIVWLFSMVLGYSRLIWARFVVHQDLQSVLRCHIAALEAIGGAPREILYDRMKAAVIGEDPDGLVIYNRALLDLARHYGFQPRACRPYRPKTKGKVERPFRYIRDSSAAGSIPLPIRVCTQQAPITDQLAKVCIKCVKCRAAIDTDRRAHPSRCRLRFRDCRCAVHGGFDFVGAQTTPRSPEFVSCGGT
jgi:transposase